MAGERTFVVKILGNSDGAITAFKNLGREGMKTIGQIKSIGSSLGDAFDVVKKATLVVAGALTAVAGAASAAVYAAAQDQESQRLLAAQLERSAGATLQQVAATEAFVRSAMLATGIADDDLRPAFGNLARATGDLTLSQRLLNLSLDISAATGRDLESVSLAVGRAATGQVAALTRLGVPLDEAAVKGKDFSTILTALEGQFGGASAVAADTFAGRVRILKTGLGEATESIGYALLPFAEKLVGFINKNIVPALTAFADHIGKDGLGLSIGYALNAMGDLGPSFVDVLEQMTMAVLTFLLQFLEIGRNIALLIGFTAALSGNISLAVKATAASLAFKAGQDVLNKALAATPGKFDAIRAAMIAAQNATDSALPRILGTADALERTGRAAGVAVKDTEDFKNTTGGVAKVVETAKQKMEKYTDALKGSTSAQKALTSAQRGTIDAQKNLDKANSDVASAQEKFNQAVAGYGADSKQAKDAQRDLDKAQRGVERAGYRVEESLFAVTDAEKKLAEVRADPESSAQAIREAELNLAQAKLAVSDATDAQFDATNGLAKAQGQLNEIVGGAIVGSIIYDSLLKDLNDAKETQITASQRLSDAIQNEKDAFEALADAIKKVADAASRIPGGGLAIPTIPTVPIPVTGTTSVSTGGGATITINTGIGTNGVEAGRQIVEAIQQYSKIAADPLGINARQ